MKIVKHRLNGGWLGLPQWTGKWKVIDNEGNVLYLSKNRKACERYIKLHRK